MNNYQILWLNDDLLVKQESNKFKLLDGLRKEAEEQLKLSIQTCITGKDFLVFAHDKKQNWDVFVIDAMGKMSDDEESPKDILGTILKDIDRIVSEQNILLYCLTEELGNTTGGYENGSLYQMLDDYNFVKTSTGKRFYDLQSASSLFKDVKNKLDENGKLFRNYREIEELYLDIKRSSGGTKKEETDAIVNMLRWHCDKSSNVKDFENGIRLVVEYIGDQLNGLGFFSHAGLPFSPAHNNFDLVSGIMNDITQRNKNGQYFYSTDCRWNWEATAIYFLGDMSNISHHALQKENGNTEDYNTYYREMIFCAFVLFSKWYWRFRDTCKKNGADLEWMLNPLYNANSLPIDPNMIYEGSITQSNFTNKKQIKPKCTIKGILGSIPIDWSVPVTNFYIGQRVYFKIIVINGKYFANNITI